MSGPADWYRNEQALLASVRSTSGGARRAPDIPGYDDLRELGRGGQGVVYTAGQRSTKRTVAIKVLLEGAFAAESTRRRFEREVDLVASLRHPNIVRVYDSGVTADGYPYYVMEYIEGATLDEQVGRVTAVTGGRSGSAAVDSRTVRIPDALPSIEGTLRLFAKICEAVNYAHQRGVIHRDLKPSNIRIDPAGEPHVLDFGLAKSAMTGDDMHTAMMTVSGQFTGSLPWASPEQTEGEPGRVDIRSDVYSLGVLLYQLLTGRFPYAVTGTFPDVIRNIQLASPARPRALRPQIGDELETIVLKAIAKERERRYQSAGELARDIQHLLNHEPIEAKRDSTWYTLRKSLYRYRLVAGIACAFLVIAVGVAITTTVLYRRAVRAERFSELRRTQAEAQAEKALRTKQFLQGMFGSLDPVENRGRDAAMLRAILADAAGRVPVELSGQPEVEASVRATIGRTYASLGDYVAAEENLDRAARLYRGLDEAADTDRLGVLSDLAGVYQEEGRFEDAEPLAREALDGFRRAQGENHADTLTAKNNLAFLLHSLGRLDDAETLYRETLDRQRELLGEENRGTLSSKGNLAQLLMDEGRLEEAAPLVLETLAARQRVLGPDHPDTVTSVNNAARLAQEQGQLDQAESLYKQAIDGYRRVFGEDHPRTVMAMSNLGVLCQQRGRYAESEALLREALEAQRRRIADDDPAAAVLLNNLARTLQESNKLAEAEPLVRQVYATLQNAYGPEHPQTLTAMNNLAGLLSDLDLKDEARELFRECFEIRRKTVGLEHTSTLLVGVNYASALRDGGDPATALALFDEMSQAAAALPADHWLRPYLHGARGESLYLLKRYAEAEEPLLESYHGFQSTLGAAHASTQRATTRLFDLYEAWGKPEKALEFAPHREE